jgi:hypothetical protein
MQERAIFTNEYGRLELRRSKADAPLRIQAKYIHPILDKFPMKELITTVLPLAIPSITVPLPEFQICWSCLPSVWQHIYNAPCCFASFDIEHNQQILESNQCACHSFPSIFKPPHTVIAGHAHVQTTDLSLIQDPLLAQELSLGLNHIPYSPISFQELLECNTTILATAANVICRDLGIPFQPTDLHAAPSMVHTFTKQWLYTRPILPVPLSQGSYFLTSSAQTLLSSLSKQFYFHELDKASRQPVITCMVLARHLIASRLSSPDFQRLPISPESAISSFTADVQALTNGKLLSMPDRLPSIRFSYKAHKDPPAMRWLTNASECALTPLDNLVASSSAALLLALQTVAGMKQDTYKQFAGITTCLYPLVTNPPMVTLNLPTLLHHSVIMDISKCYECIPTHFDADDSLQKAVKYMCKQAFSALGDLYFRVRLDPSGMPISTQLSPKSHHTMYVLPMDSDTFLQAVDLLVNNATVKAASAVYRQTMGIPMGLASSPALCNLYLLSYEWRFTRALAAAKPDPLRDQLLAGMLSYMRYIDDAWVINSPALATLITAPPDPTTSLNLYPPCLVIKVTASNSENRMTYLDISIHRHANGTYSTSMFFKSEKLPFPVVQYISPASCRPSYMLKGIVAGMTVSALYHCSSNKLAKYCITAACEVLVTRGWPRKTIMAAVQATLSDSFPGSNIHRKKLIHSLRI